MREVREKPGLDYWIYTLLYNFKHSTMLIGGFASPNKDVATSLELVHAEFQSRRRRADAGGGRCGQELSVGSFVLSLDSNAKIAEQMLKAQLQGQGTDFATTSARPSSQGHQADVRA